MKAQIDYTLISGKITNKTDKEFTINSLLNTYPKVKIPIKVSATGTISDTIGLKEGKYYLYNEKNAIPIYIKPGHNLVINFDAENFKKTLSVSGKGSIICHYLSDKYRITKEKTKDKGALYKLEEKEFKKLFQAIKLAHTSLLESYKNISDSQFRGQEKRDINYAYLKKLIQHTSLHPYLTGKEGYKQSENFLNELDEVNYSIEEDYLLSNNYRFLLSVYFTMMRNKIMKKNQNLI
ncbi:hypothetical protein VOI54_17585 [Tamlana sp. 2201CG12-4]|uniref:hypothetical protein n=1 Tax=Tamlana sp. 2201CG12-4 TaxID=3112582 RepID=UPI002DB821A3|nr:hypothetical protein [Tamlana sp. 2201CG12-4]MEC3908844.1 hypothetical protein [Tamlana sp. 2201CG12-4]